MIVALPISKIVRRDDARAINVATVAALAESIDSVGLINPIRVRERLDHWEVSAGSHRLAACKKLGLETVNCIVSNDDDLHAELSMIDENLCRNELSPAERASQTARRKSIYLELHPETAAGVAGAEAKHGRATDNLSFAAETAKVSGKDERTVQRDAERGEKVIPEVVQMISGTKLDTGTYLDRIKNLTPNEQVTAAKRDLLAIRNNEKPKKSAPAPRPVGDVHEGQISALISAWNKATKEAREEFMRRVEIPFVNKDAAA